METLGMLGTAGCGGGLALSNDQRFIQFLGGINRNSQF